MTATYWVKHIVSISVLAKPLSGFWMNPAYRIPKGEFPQVDRFVSQETDSNMPITEMVVNSLLTSPLPGERIRRGALLEVKGIAWDGGYGIHRVEVSIDGGRIGKRASLGRQMGAMPSGHSASGSRLARPAHLRSWPGRPIALVPRRLSS
ncbi:hypothetical protein [Cupriavidus necator]